MILFISGFLLSLSLCLDIGIVNTAIINTSIRKGLISGFMIGFGSCFGDLAYAIGSILGLSLLFSIPILKFLIWISGTILLSILIIKMILDLKKESRTKDNVTVETNKRMFFVNGLLLALSSPTSIIWFASVGAGLIAGQSYETNLSYVYFFSGFFLAGLFWSFSLASFFALTRKSLSIKQKKRISLISIFLLSVLLLITIIKGYSSII
jgi:L-lysine exporter family protein LysE/ArgO